MVTGGGGWMRAEDKWRARGIALRFGQLLPWTLRMDHPIFFKIRKP
jgi:hypothetical protein